MTMKSASPAFSQRISPTLIAMNSAISTALANIDIISRQAGEDLIVGDPVYVSANLLYKADNVTNPRVVGVVTTAALTGFSAIATISGKITLSGLTDATPYFLGNLIITSSAPSSGRVIRMGTSISTTEFLLNIEEPILLA